MKLTKQQRTALKRVYDRQPLYRHITGALSDAFEKYPLSTTPQCEDQNPATYRQFRRTVQHGYDCIMVNWCGMWLGIETDGYTHS